MKTAIAAILTFAALLTIVTGCQLFSDREQQDAELEELKQELTAIKLQVMQLEAELALLKQENTRLRDSQEELARAVKELDQYHTEMATDIQALHWLACLAVGNPYAYHTYLATRYGEAEISGTTLTMTLPGNVKIKVSTLFP